MEYILVLTTSPDALQATLDQRSLEGWMVHTFKAQIRVRTIQFSVLLERERQP